MQLKNRNQSILEIEDIDCSSELQGQQAEEHNPFFPLHKLFLICYWQLTPTAIAEELMKSEEADSALGKLAPQKGKESTKWSNRFTPAALDNIIAQK